MYNGDVKFRNHVKLVHDNGGKAFTNEEFNLLENWQHSEIKKGPETVRKANLLERLNKY